MKSYLIQDGESKKLIVVRYEKRYESGKSVFLTKYENIFLNTKSDNFRILD